MASEQKIKDILNHLTFLGYEITPVSGQQHIAKHASRNNLLVNALGANMVSFVALLATNRVEHPAMAQIVNRGNQNVILSNISYSQGEDGKVQILFGSTYAGKYDRASFGEFMDCVENDILNFIRSEEVTTNFGGSS